MHCPANKGWSLKHKNGTIPPPVKCTDCVNHHSCLFLCLIYKLTSLLFRMVESLMRVLHTKYAVSIIFMLKQFKRECVHILSLYVCVCVCICVCVFSHCRKVNHIEQTQFSGLASCSFWTHIPERQLMLDGQRKKMVHYFYTLAGEHMLNMTVVMLLCSGSSMTILH